jgi:hypothetical protein
VTLVREFAANEITILGANVTITEVATYVDTATSAPYLVDDPRSSYGTILDPTIGTHAPVAYKAFEPLTKTVDFTLLLHWTFQFGG